MNYKKDVEEDARDFLTEHEDEFKEAIKDGKEFHGIDEVHDWLHESVTDRAYTPQDAVYVLEECENEENDSGIWEGLDDWRQELSARAAYSYSNDVYYKASEIYEELKERYEELVDEAGECKEDEDEDERNEKILNQVWGEFTEEDKIEPITPGGQEEIDLIEQWLEMGKNAGSWNGYPMGGSYIDARCGVGFGMPDVKDYVDFDREVAKKLPHLSGKYQTDVRARLDELKK